MATSCWLSLRAASSQDRPGQGSRWICRDFMEANPRGTLSSGGFCFLSSQCAMAPAGASAGEGIHHPSACCSSFHFPGARGAFGRRPAYFYAVVTVARTAFNSFFSPFSYNTKPFPYYIVVMVSTSQRLPMGYRVDRPNLAIPFSACLCLCWLV